MARDEGGDSGVRRVPVQAPHGMAVRRGTWAEEAHGWAWTSHRHR
jgi:hypothetical protein